MLGPFDKPAELKIQPLPFELMFQMAEKRQQRADKAEENMSALTGAFASLQTAPGHEQYKVQALKPYQDALQGFMNKYSDMSDPRAIRELTNIKSSFANDPNIHNIVESKQTYDKFAPELYKAKNTGAVFTGSVFDKNGEIKQNTQRYTPDELSFIPQADIAPEIDIQLNKVKAEIATLNHKPRITYMDGPNGEKIPMIQQGRTDSEKKDLNTFMNAMGAIKRNLMQSNSDASRYFNALNNNSEEALEYQILNQVIPMLYNNSKTDLSHSQFSGGDDDKSFNPFNTPLQTSLDTNNLTKSTIDNINSLLAPKVTQAKTNTYTGGSIMGTALQTQPNNNVTYENLENNLNSLDKLRVSFIKNKLGLSKLSSKEDWDKVKTELNNSNANVYSAVEGFNPGEPAFNSKQSEQYTKDINVQLPQYSFYIPSLNQVVPGSKLGVDADKKPIVVSQTAGYLVGNNPIPDNISTEGKLSFARPVQVTLSNGEIAYMGENFYNLNSENLVNNPKAIYHFQAAVQNAVTTAQRAQTVTPLVPGSGIYVIPNSNNEFRIINEQNQTLGTGSFDQPVQNYFDLLSNDQIYKAIFGKK